LWMGDIMEGIACDPIGKQHRKKTYAQALKFHKLGIVVKL
jgi:hypothetical protein